MSLWKNLRGSGDEQDQPSDVPAPPAPSPVAPARATVSERRAVSERRPAPERESSGQTAHIGKSLSFKGNVTGDEDTVIDGRVEGRVEFRNHHLTIGPNGDITGEIGAKKITIVGRVTGNVTAAERVEISETGRLQGDIIAPRLVVQEGGQVNGSIAMRPAQTQSTAQTQPAQTQPPAPAKKTEKAEKTEAARSTATASPLPAASGTAPAPGPLPPAQPPRA